MTDILLHHRPTSNPQRGAGGGRKLVSFLLNAARRGVSWLGDCGGIVLFWTLCPVLLAVFTYQITRLLPLYTDASVRREVQDVLQYQATIRGWLLSDAPVVRVGTDSFDVLLHEHTRRMTPTDCMNLSLSFPVVRPCGS